MLYTYTKIFQKLLQWLTEVGNTNLKPSHVEYE